MNKNLYQWQEECLKRWQANGCRGMVQAVTGSGKTLLALTAAHRLEEYVGEDLKIKIVVPTGALMRQWGRALKEFLADFQKPGGTEEAGYKSRQPSIGMRGGGFRDAPDCRYMIYVINSARYELARQILAELKEGKAVFLIADECHHYDSGQNRLIFEFLPFIEPYRERFFSMGLSATLPAGRSREYLASVLGRKIYSYGMEEASAFGTVCKYDIFHIQLSFQREERDEYEELTDRMVILYQKLLKAHPLLDKVDIRERFEMLRNLCSNKDKAIAEAAALYLRLSYRRKSLVCLASERIFCACDLIQTLGTDGKILIFGERIRQAEKLYKLLKDKYPGRVGRYHSEMGDQANKNALERFRTGEIRILIACKAIDEGVDVPDASVGIILSGTATRRQRLQRLGRILRINEGKDRASLYYLHIEETSEDACFLPDGKDNAYFELEYCSAYGKFFNLTYDRAASKVLADMKRNGRDGETIKEAGRCLKLGSVRSDWKREQEYIEGKIKDAKSIRDRNYWVCMKRVSLVLDEAGSATDYPAGMRYQPDNGTKLL